MSALAAALAIAAAPAFAAAPAVVPKVLQCDGSFAAGTVTAHPAPTVRAEIQSTNPGLKIGQRRLSVLASSTLALWRFDGDYDVTVSSCYTVGCPAGDSCKTWQWAYNDANLSASAQTGQCTYRDTAGTSCANTMSLYGLGSNQAVVPIGGATCLASTSTLPSASGTVAITPLGPLTGTAANGLSAQALQLNGSSLYGTSPNSNTWNLPATYTLAAWINATGATGRIISQQGATGWWGMGVSGGGLRHFDSRDAAAFPSDLTNSDVSFGSGLTGGWHLVHVVRQNAIKRKFYIDGRFVGEATAASTNSFTSHPNTATLEIGRYGGGSEYFNGMIDDLRILNTALLPEDIFLEWTTQMHYYSTDGGVRFSTTAGTYSGSPSNGTTGVVTYIPTPNTYSANARWGFTGATIDGEGAAAGSYGVAIDNSPPIAPALTGTPTSINDITWSWGAPPRVCVPPGSASVTYNLVDAPSNSNLIPPGAIAYPTASVGENIPGAPNQLVGRKLRVTDTWGQGLGAATSVYTLASPPVSVTASAVSTGSALISWGQNGNPSYTRYLFSYSQNSSFATGVSTPVTMADGFTGSSVTLPILSMGSTYYARVQAFSGRSSDPYGLTGTAFASTSFTTLPAAPNLGGSPAGVANRILWTWTTVPGALSYNLYDSADVLLYAGSGLSHNQTGLATNTQYTCRVEAVSAGGAGARGLATAFTLANDPTAPVVVAAYASSVTYAWNGGLNPAYTFYEVALTTDSTFGIVVTTLTVNATTATITGLLPATSYYARMRSVNGSQVLGNYVSFASTRTVADPAITITASPPSAYVPPGGSTGQWHFDESTGVVAADSAGPNNTAFLTCLTASCVSTPTFVAGPAGLGSAVSFSGLAGSLVRVPDAAQYALTGSMTVSAWVNPSSLAQPSGAGIVVRGSGTVENFALETSGGLWRFLPKPGFIAASTSSISLSNWTHLTGVYDAAAGSATLYVNGRPASTVLAVPARTSANHDISIGNRQSGLATAYDRGFLGSIDSVRVMNKALSAAEALAEYQGSFVSTVTPPAPNNTVLIGLAPNAFGAPATIIVSVDPIGHPITITPAVLNAGLTVIPTGFTLVPNSLIEIVPIVGGTPFTQTLGSSASVSMPYADANGDNIIDLSNPKLAASALKVYTLNTTVNRWELLPTYVDPASRRVTFFTPHFSVFAMFAPLTIGASLAQVRVYPIPWRPRSLSRFDADGITFDRLPAAGVIRLINLAGERVRELSFDGSSAGSIRWDGLTDRGARAASGVYFARITAADGSVSLVKVAIEK